MRWSGLGALVFVPALLPAQATLSLSPRTLNFQAVTTALGLGGQQIEINTTSAWTAALGGGPRDMVTLNKYKGTGKDTVIVGVAEWWVQRQPPGTYQQTISIAPVKGGTPQTVQVSLRIAAALPGPKFSYIGGPHGCSDLPGLAAAALCTVPDEKPAGSFQPPGPGKSYNDPNFGARVTILTPAPMVHGYSSPTAISANDHYVLAGRTADGNSNPVDLMTGKVTIEKGLPLEGGIWDAKDDSVLYVAGGHPAGIYKHDLRSHTTEMIADFSRPPYSFSGITTGGTGDGSKDNWLAFYAPGEQQLCAFSVAGKKAYCASLKSVPGGPYNVDFPTISKGPDAVSRKRYVIAVTNPMLVFSVNEATGRLDLEMRGPEQVGMGNGNRDGICDPGEACVNGSHSDVFEDSKGQQWLMAAQEYQVPCEYALVSYRLNAGARMGLPVELGGGMRHIMTLFRCGGQDVWPDLHIGCAKASPYCVVSTTYGGFKATRQPNDTSPARRGPYLSEIFVVRDNGAEVRRLAEHRSVPYSNEEANGYWSNPRACISPDGAYVVADSNFGFPNAQRVIRIDTGFGK